MTGRMIIAKAGEVGRNNLVFAPETLASQDGKTIPLTDKPGGNVVGSCTMAWVPEEGILYCDYEVESIQVAEMLAQRTTPNSGIKGE